MKWPRNTLEVRYNRQAAEMLFDFVNTRPEPEAFERFRRHWERYGLRWPGGEMTFRDSQNIVQQIWKGEKKGATGPQVAVSIGFLSWINDGGEVVVHQQPPIGVDWDMGCLFLNPGKLDDLIWLTLLQHSRRLAICSNKDDCLTPFFLKYRPQARFCSDACAKPSQRESKRRWWMKNRAEWLRKHGKKKSPKRR